MDERDSQLTLVMGVLTAETMTTSSAELINSLALPNEGMAEVMLCRVEDMVLIDLKLARVGMMTTCFALS